MELTILMPCLNEAATIGVCIKKARNFLSRSGIAGEVLISDNGSTDGSVEIAKVHGARVVETIKKGYGAALSNGIVQANGNFVIMGDCDDSYDFENLDGFLKDLRLGKQLVIGNRFAGGISEGAMPKLHRYFGNPILSSIGKIFFKSKLNDFHCGLRAFHRESIIKLDLSSPGMEFASEMIVKATLRSYLISEVSTTLHKDGRGRPSHLRTWRDGWRHLKFLLLFCPRWLFIYPGILLASAGVAGLIATRLEFFKFESIGFGVHTLLYASAAIVLGVQAIQLGMLTMLMGLQARISRKPDWFKVLEPYVSLEKSLVVGGMTFMMGLIWSFKLVENWRELGFGVLNPEEEMQAAIPAVTLMIVGIQACAGALFASAICFYWGSANHLKVNEN